MSLLSILLVLVLVGVGLYLVRSIPMDETIQKIITAVVILVVVLWLLESLGLFRGLSLPRLR